MQFLPHPVVGYYFPWKHTVHASVWIIKNKNRLLDTQFKVCSICHIGLSCICNSSNGWLFNVFFFLSFFLLHCLKMHCFIWIKYTTQFATLHYLHHLMHLVFVFVLWSAIFKAPSVTCVFCCLFCTVWLTYLWLQWPLLSLPFAHVVLLCIYLCNSTRLRLGIEVGKWCFMECFCIVQKHITYLD